MKKIIPILSLCVAVLTVCVAIIGLTTVSIAVSVAQASLVAIPTIIIGAMVSALSAPMAFIFRQDKLCRIAFYIDVTAAVISLISIIIWLCAL